MSTILVVDDDEVSRALLGSLLRGAGHRIIEAANGFEALARAHGERPDLIVTDVLMPGMDGYELLHKLRMDPPIAGIPVVFYTAAYLQDEVRGLAERWGSCIVLAKPAEPAAILQAAERALAELTGQTSFPPEEEFELAHRGILNAKLVQRVRELEESEAERQRLIQALREMSDQRQRLLIRLVRAQEEEAKRISGDIHDDSIQVMSAVGLRLGLLARQLGDGEKAETLNELQSLVTLSIGKLRRLLFELRPIALDKGTLASALSEHLEYVEREEGLEFSLRDTLTQQPPQESRVILYRVAQEALSNIRKHASARHAEITLQDSEGGFLLRIVDDGQGFAAEERPSSPLGHLGLTAIRERAEGAGGWARVVSRPGEGTTVECWLPGGTVAGAPV